MIIRATLAALASVILAGCGTLTDYQNHLLVEARAIDQYPVKRQILVTKLGLEGLPSQRFDGGVRSRRMFYTEIWELRSGLTVGAWDSEYVGEIPGIPGSIDHILNARSGSIDHILNAYYDRQNIIGPARDSFEGFTISRGDMVIYRSDEAKREQAVGCNRRPRPLLNSGSIPPVHPL